MVGIYHFQLSFIHLFNNKKNKMKCCNLNIFGYWIDNLKRTWNLAPVLQVVQKITENYCTAYIYQLAKNTKTWIRWEWNIIFLWNKRNLNLCFRWHNLKSSCSVVEVTFKLEKGQQCYMKMLKWFVRSCRALLNRILFVNLE